MKHLTLGKLFRFAVVGGGATALQYLIAAFLHWGLGCPAAIASGVGFALSAIANYIANASFTFGVQGGHRQSLPRFAVVAACGCLLNTAGMALALRQGIPIVPAQLGVTLLVMLWNFTLNAVWSFKGDVNK